MKAINLSSTKDPAMYDYRVAIYEKLGRTKDALLDSRKVIQLFPERWQVSSLELHFHPRIKHDNWIGIRAIRTVILEYQEVRLCFEDDQFSIGASPVRRY